MVITKKEYKMTDNKTLNVNKREGVGKGAARATRREGMVPAVIYGGSQSPTAISIDPRLAIKGLNSGHFFSTVYTLDIDGGDSEKVIVRDVQFHPVSDAVQHIDFLRVTDRTRVHLFIPVHYVGQEECKGIKFGGIFNIVRHEVEVSCLAANIPDELTCDISGYDIGDTIKISSVTLPNGVSPTITDRDFVLANISAPKSISDESDDDSAEESGDDATEADEQSE